MKRKQWADPKVTVILEVFPQVDEKSSSLSGWRPHETKPEPFSSTPYLIILPTEKLHSAYKDTFFLHQKYVVEGLSVRQIAADIFSSKEAVRKGLIRSGVTLREPHHSHGRPSQPAFGFKIRNGRARPHVAEQELLVAIADLRKQGLTLRAIAGVLSQIGVPTKKRGVKWHPQMVKRILGARTNAAICTTGRCV